MSARTRRRFDHSWLFGERGPIASGFALRLNRGAYALQWQPPFQQIHFAMTVLHHLATWLISVTDIPGCAALFKSP